MKTRILTFALLTIAASVFAQGTVVFNNRVAGTIVTKVYPPQHDGFGQRIGNTAADTPPGTQTYTGEPLSGAGWVAELWAAPGANTVESFLVPASPTTTFRTGSAAGFVVGTTAILAGVPGDSYAATLQLRVYPSTYATWAAAAQAWMSGLTEVWMGKSPLFTVYSIGGQANPAPSLIGLQSFSLISIPEPSVFALMGLGTVSLLILRRR